MAEGKDNKNSKHFCILPWIHLHAWPNGKVYPCCFTNDWEYVLGDLSSESIEEVWNSEKTKALRKKMLAGEASSVCNVCYKREASGAESMRERMLQKFSHHLDIAKQTKPDGHLNSIQMPYFDIRFSNLCNFKCRSCSPEFSSAWMDDTVKIEANSKKQNKVINFATNQPNIWQELEKLISTMEELYFAGGEPLLMPEHYRFLDLLIKHKKFNTKIVYNTNLSKLSLGDKNIIEYWKQFPNLSVAISLDDIKERAEFTRHGTNWPLIEKNIRSLQKECPHIYLSISPTISVYNVLNIPEFHQYLIHKLNIHPERFDFYNFVQDPVHLNIQILPKEIKAKVRRKLQNYIKKTLKPEKQQSIIEQIQSIIYYMEQKDLSEKIQDFQKQTTLLDKVRKENTKEIIPELGAIL